MKRHNDDAWAEAQRRCQLSDEEVRMAKELGFQPKSLIKRWENKGFCHLIKNRHLFIFNLSD